MPPIIATWSCRPAPAFGNQVDAARSSADSTQRSNQGLDAPQVAATKAADPLAISAGDSAKAADAGPNVIPAVPGSNVGPDPATIGPQIAAPFGRQSASRSRCCPAAGRPEDLQPTLPPEPASVEPARPSAPVDLAPRQIPRSELVIQDKPEPAVGPQPTAQAAPIAPSVETKPEPKDPGPEPGRTGPRTNKNSGVPFDPSRRTARSSSVGPSRSWCW